MQRTELAVLAYTADGAVLAVRLRKVLGAGCRVFLHSAHAARELHSSHAALAARCVYEVPAVCTVYAEQEFQDSSGEDGAARFTDTGSVLNQIWEDADAILFIGAAGIAVRSAAPHLRGKAQDPAVLCMDDTASFVIPLLSGHLGGANEWAVRIAAVFGAEPVITTSTDRHGVFAVDLFAKANGLVIEDPGMIRKISGALLAGEKVGWCCGESFAGVNPGTEALMHCSLLPSGIRTQDADPDMDLGFDQKKLQTDDAKVQTDHAKNQTDHAKLQTDHVKLQADHVKLQADHVKLQADHTKLQADHASGQEETSGICRPQTGITLTDDSSLPAQFVQECRLYPRNIYLGIGCRRGKSAAEIGGVVKEAFDTNGISMKRICAIASIDLKKDEKGIRELARQFRAEFLTFSAQQLMETEGDFTGSEYVLEQVGADNVCERSAVKASGGKLIFGKYAKDGVTVAAAGRKL